MSVTEFKRGVPTYKDNNDNEYGLLCETKEVCVTDNDGVSLEYKLQTLMQNISNLTSELQSCVKASEINDIKEGTTQVGNAKTLDGHGAEDFATAVDLLNYLSKSGGKINGEIQVEQSDIGQLALSGYMGNSYFCNRTTGSSRFRQINIQNPTNYADDNNALIYEYQDASGIGHQTNIIHTGNSAKVVVSETAPSDTSALWVW